MHGATVAAIIGRLIVVTVTPYTATGSTEVWGATGLAINAH